MTAPKKPGTLADVRLRFAAMVEHSEESLEDWADLLGTTGLRLTALVNGMPVHGFQPRLSSRELLIVDDVASGWFLSPPERRWAEWAKKHAERHARYMATRAAA